jgi:hypothetical protein
VARHLKLIRRVILWMRTVGTLLLGCWMSSVCSMLRMVAVGNRQGRLLYLAAVSALAPELFDQPLRRSFHGRRPTATFLVRAGLLIVWLHLNVSGFRLVLARGWHRARLSMRTVGTTLLAVKRCSVVCVWMPAQDGRSLPSGPACGRGRLAL